MTWALSGLIDLGNLLVAAYHFDREVLEVAVTARALDSVSAAVHGEK